LEKTCPQEVGRLPLRTQINWFQVDARKSWHTPTYRIFQIAPAAIGFSWSVYVKIELATIYGNVDADHFVKTSNAKPNGRELPRTGVARALLHVG
jgi:hypothetical protein